LLAEFFVEEHAPWALEANGITAVIAPGFARIFRQNMFNCGMVAIELSPEDVDRLFAHAATPAEISFDLAGATLVLRAGQVRETFSFPLPPFARALIDAGGWVEFADRHY